MQEKIKDDMISRRAAIDFIDAGHSVNPNEPRWSDNEVVNFLKSRPSAQPEQTDCEYCHEDSDWYVRPIEKNSHAVIFGSVLYLKVKGWCGKVQIKYCPMCGRRLE